MIRSSHLRGRHAAARRPAEPGTSLARDLAAFDSPSDLLELSAILYRYDDAETADIRTLVDWSRAA
jgi:hypothetical protein